MFNSWNRVLKYLFKRLLHKPTSLLWAIKQNNIRVSEYLNGFEIENSKFIFHLRKNSSDIEVYNQIIVDKEYQILLDYFDLNSIQPKLIIDCGANIGLTSLIFATHFENVKILSVEPDKSNFLQLQKNTKNFENITSIQKGVWPSNTKLSIDRNFRDGKDWSIRTLETKTNTDESIDSVTISQLINESGFSEIDLLKIDIEGAEKELFKDVNTSVFLERTKCIAIEIHDEIADRLNIYSILKHYGFKLITSGEITIGLRLIDKF